MRSLPQLPPEAPAAEAAECRGCGVVCQKVIYPSECLARSCPFLYAHEAFGRTYVGCTHKIFTTELDLAVLRRASRRRSGFGAVLAARQPLPVCSGRGGAELRGSRGSAGVHQPRVPRAARLRAGDPRDRQRFLRPGSVAGQHGDVDDGRSAVDGQHRAGDVRGLGGHEESHRGRPPRRRCRGASGVCTGSPAGSRVPDQDRTSASTHPPWECESSRGKPS